MVGIFLLLLPLPLLLNSPMVHWTLDPELQWLCREASTGLPAVRKGLWGCSRALRTVSQPRLHAVTVQGTAFEGPTYWAPYSPRA